MVRDYELMYIVRPDVDDDALQQATAGVERIIQSQGGEVVSTTSWGKRRLAYEIDKLRDGHYVIVHMRVEPDGVAGVERLLHINDSVLRHMVTVWVARDGGEAASEATAPSAPEAEVESAGPETEEEEEEELELDESAVPAADEDEMEDR